MANYTANRGHRPATVINWEELDKLCFMQSTIREIAHWVKCSPQAIENRCAKEQGMSFGKYFEKKSAGGLISLRRNLFKLSESNVAAAIFLAKNYLGMSDKQEIEHSGNISSKPEDLTDAELTAILLRRRNKYSRRTVEETASPLSSD